MQKLVGKIAQDAQVFRKCKGGAFVLLGVALVAMLAVGCTSRQGPSPSAGLEAPADAGSATAQPMETGQTEAEQQDNLAKDPSAADKSSRMAGKDSTLTTYPPNGSANFVSEKGNFEVFFPAPPKRTVKDQRNIVGEFFSVQHKGAHYFAGYFVHPYKGLDKLILRRSINRVKDKVGGGSLDAQTISFGGKTGKEFLIQGGTDGVMVSGRYYCFGNRVYLTRYSAPISQFLEDEAQQFLDSFNPSPSMQTASWLQE